LVTIDIAIIGEIAANIILKQDGRIVTFNRGAFGIGEIAIDIIAEQNTVFAAVYPATICKVAVDVTINPYRITIFISCCDVAGIDEITTEIATDLGTIIGTANFSIVAKLPSRSSVSSTP